MKHNRIKQFAKILAIMVIAIIIGALTYLGDYYRGDAEAYAALAGSQKVQVEDLRDQIIFTPKGVSPTKGLIFYQGGKVEAEAYGVMLSQIAEQGFMVVIPKMPFKLAVLGRDRAAKIIADHADMDWMIGGHSLGGAMASDFSVKQPDDVKGVILLGAYANEKPISHTIRYQLIAGTDDGILDWQAFDQALEALPRDSKIHEIIGGNHSYFANYGLQAGDHEGSIKREDQQLMAVNHISEFLEEEVMKKETKQIILGGGCFWGMEKYFQEINGVVETEVGFANGNTKNPTYEDVTYRNTGHAEVVKLKYDPDVASLPFLLNMYYKVIDPTVLNRQGNDIGTQYRTGIYFIDPQDEGIIKNSLNQLQEEYKKKIAIELMPLDNYTEAGREHQKYLDKNPNGYCHIGKDKFDMAKDAVDQTR